MSARRLRTRWLLCLLLAAGAVSAQQSGTKTVKSKYLKRQIKAWTVSERLGVADSVAPDTSFLNYYQNDMVHRYSMVNAYNGNMLSPLQSKIYFDRQHKTDFLFSDAFNNYVITPTDVRYYNSLTPYSNITYRTGGKTYRKEDEVNFMFAGNSDRRTGYGITLSYMAPVGSYDNQSSKRFNGSLFASHDGDRYYIRGSAMLNTLSVHENGGLIDSTQLNDDIQPQDASTRLTSSLSGYRYWAFYLNHGYRLGFDKEVRGGNSDTVETVFIPVTTFIHTLQVNGAAHRYYEPRTDTLFYANTYLNSHVTNDTASLREIKNTLAVTFEEGFNKLGFGLTAYVNNEVQQYAFAVADSTVRHEWLSSTRIGATLSRTQGRVFGFRVDGDLCLLGYKLGEFNISGNVEGKFRLGRDSVRLRADAYVRNQQPDYFTQHYLSNHFSWSNSFDKIYRIYAGGRLDYSNRFLNGRLKVGVENVTNLVYFGEDFLPRQHSGSVQVFSADLKLNLHSPHWAWENQLVYQESSDAAIPLPKLSLYTNLYFYARLFSVLDVQLGADMRYHTSYYAPLYMPATGQFCTQRDMQVGNYPLMSVYGNFRLKTVRFYVGYTHFNYHFGNYSYYSMPLYPLNPAQLKLGVSWSFFD